VKEKAPTREERLLAIVKWMRDNNYEWVRTTQNNHTMYNVFDVSNDQMIRFVHCFSSISRMYEYYEREMGMF
jgi:hypothetical protein